LVNQLDDAYDVCVVDDNSSDRKMRDIVTEYAENWGWEYILQDERRGAMYNQVKAIERLDPDPEDVIVWVDGDDRLAHNNVLTNLRHYYRDDTVLTFGNYDTDPPDPACPEVRDFPPETIHDLSYRKHALDGRGMFFNHLRTVKFHIFDQLCDADFKDRRGKWFTTNCDTAVMIPCLELARGKHKVIDEVLLTYTSDGEQADWRVRPKEVDKNNQEILRRPTKAY
jgi:glycosyltransferase involved in cell wall biosynthesis